MRQLSFNQSRLGYQSDDMPGRETHTVKQSVTGSVKRRWWCLFSLPDSKRQICTKTLCVQLYKNSILNSLIDGFISTDCHSIFYLQIYNCDIISVQLSELIQVQFVPALNHKVASLHAEKFQPQLCFGKKEEEKNRGKKQSEVLFCCLPHHKLNNNTFWVCGSKTGRLLSFILSLVEGNTNLDK